MGGWIVIKFYAINKKTLKVWEPENGKKQCLALLSSGGIVMIEENFYTYTTSLNSSEWKIVFNK